MGYTINRHPLDESIVVGTYYEPFDPIIDSAGAGQYLLDVLNASPEPLYYISDMREVTLSFYDLVIGLETAYKTPGSAFAHPNLRTFAIGTDTLIGIGVKVVNEQTAKFGEINVKFYRNIDEALTEIMGRGRKE